MTATAARSIKNGTLKFKDGAAGSMTVTFQDGGLSGDMRAKEFIPVRHRGAIQQFIEGDDQVLEFTLSFTYIEIESTTTATFASLVPFEILQTTNNNTVTQSSTGLSGEPTLFNVELTIADPAGGSSNEVLTWSKCVCPRITLEEGYPTKWTATIQCRGGMDVVYTA